MFMELLHRRTTIARAGMEIASKKQVLSAAVKKSPRSEGAPEGAISEHGGPADTIQVTVKLNTIADAEQLPLAICTGLRRPPERTVATSRFGWAAALAGNRIDPIVPRVSDLIRIRKPAKA
jgi:hypothetical protein